MRRSPISQSRFVALWRYGLTAMIVAAALVLTLFLEHAFTTRLPVLFFAAVAASAWIGGKGAGWLAAILSTLAIEYFLIPPLHTFGVTVEELPFFFTFALCALVTSWFSSWRKQTEDSLRQARDGLEARVGERTVELKKVNEALLAQIAERKRAEEVLLATQADLARVARVTTIGELTASIAHEVNQPLAGIVANADACLAWLSHQDPNLQEARAAADRMIQAATQASEVIRRIRSLIYKADPERVRVHVNEVIEEAVALTRGESTRNNVSVMTDLAAELPPVLGDRIQLQQVMVNLLMNGIEATNCINDRPRRLLIRSGTQDLIHVFVVVQDFGIGMSPEVKDRLFEPFFTTKSHGIGMGLAISRSIVEGHGGRLWAESTVSQGSIFQFTLPAVDKVL
jgi:C4-dicarboxylate-specific signal transduction histidine kinase